MALYKEMYKTIESVIKKWIQKEQGKAGVGDPVSLLRTIGLVRQTGRQIDK